MRSLALTGITSRWISETTLSVLEIKDINKKSLRSKKLGRVTLPCQVNVS